VRLTQITNNVCKFSVSQTHCVALDTTGLVWIWGENKRAELGCGDNAVRESPFPLTQLQDKKITDVVAGVSYTLGIQTN
jgi:alpha-tubulin suppressor-like RCC1 family protein